MPLSCSRSLYISTNVLSEFKPLSSLTVVVVVDSQLELKSNPPPTFNRFARNLNAFRVELFFFVSCALVSLLETRVTLIF